ncbi:MAG: hypothetical protein GYA76_15190 [Verrucomicrobia bacterium]|nr:hypothetical protein [Verrucomicrobiota bacterium]
MPAGTEGNQDFSGALGMDFDVDNPILVTRLGVFDDLSDGMSLSTSNQSFSARQSRLPSPTARSPKS